MIRADTHCTFTADKITCPKLLILTSDVENLVILDIQYSSAAVDQVTRYLILNEILTILILRLSLPQL